MLLLDTHYYLWMMEGNEKVSKNQRLQKEIEKRIPKKEILVSEISHWEIAMLASKGRIQISEPIEIWLEESLKAPGIRSIHLTPKIIADSVNLPSGFHADPSDRLIVATARVMDAQIVTQDKLIQKYGRSGNVKIFPL
jgi:PIN domain nuclease of toxin-antitoxin system